MAHPTRTDYTQAVRDYPHISILDSVLKSGTAVRGPKSLKVYSGGFSSVFPFEVGANIFALRCWITDIRDAEIRYQKISIYLKQKNLPYFVEFEYISEGILVNGSKWPITRMEWAEGDPLREFIEENSHDASLLRTTAAEFLKMADTLHSHQISHGDLQDGNILIKRNGADVEIKLIDYDSVFVPALRGYPDSIVGLSEYQHPRRMAGGGTANERLDYFSELVIYLSLIALAEKPDLWARFGQRSEKGLLFAAEDFNTPTQSQVFRELEMLSPDVKLLTSKLKEFCAKSSIDQLEPLEALLSKTDPVANVAYDKGISFFRDKRYNEAIAKFKRVVGIDSKYKEAYHGLSLTYLKMGNLDAAKREAEETLRIDANYQPTRELLNVLSKKLAHQTRIWDEIAAACEQGQTVEGTVVERIKGGLRVDIGSLRAFLPASQIELRPIPNLDKYVGTTLKLKVVKLNRRRHNIVLSRRALLEEEFIARKTEALNSLEVGQTRTGVVKNITSFGAFVDLGGIDGLLHKTDMSWKKVNQPSEIVSIGDKIEVLVIGVNREKEKVSLGLKQKTPNPWDGIEEKYPIGSTVKGKVVNIVNYGAFLELEEGVEGLIHVSEMSWTRRSVAPSKYVTKGDVIEAIVLDITRSSKRVSLGLKQLEPNPWEKLENKYPIGKKISGRVRNLTDFGAFVEIEEGIDGLIHVSDLSWLKRDVHPREILKEGDEVKVVVLQIDPTDQRVSLGLKQIEPDPWIKVPEKYKIGTVVRGEIMNLTSFGAFAKLEEAVEGLIHISELAERRIEKPEEVVKIGDQLELKVIHIAVNERRIGLSWKAAQAERKRATTAQYQEEQSKKTRGEEPATLGALLKAELDKPNSNSDS